ncbi:CIR protein [Plasmodium chabaudi chabaudi]|uniref:CIR protein n=1 Tax=Plasmodium chabaudi chabaudi TaxID=31271 RepID=A0A4V0K8T9_PLACU|nr:CIR protein [Plasmodium chabaudi chabaudi]VTZ69467.1 CIR protein [Plasmodium chabaudi chabaudi]|eukprot:XP_016654132.1 CIR protein [Plasmodium chabaudi chabaudi]
MGLMYLCKYLCKILSFIWEEFPDTLGDDGNYQLKSDGAYKTFCINETCDSDLDKINAWVLSLFEIFFKNSDSLMESAKSNINIAAYILAWLSHILSLKENEGIKNLNGFYEKYIKDKEKYNNHIPGVHGYTSYQNIIDKYKELMTDDIEYMLQFYGPLKSLCEMYNACNLNRSKCTNCLEKAKDFADKYNKLNGDSNKNESDPYKNVLYSLSTDYDNFKKYCAENCTDCNDTSSFPEIKAPQGSFQIFEATSPISPIASILIPVLLTFSITFFLGIAYKYSLFGFDKRLQRQYLREKLKKIKKKMNRYI